MSDVDLESLFKALAETSIEDYTLQAYQQLVDDETRLEYIKAVRDKLGVALESKQQAIADLESEADDLMRLEGDLVTVTKRLRYRLGIDPVVGQLPLLPHDHSSEAGKGLTSTG